MLTPRMAGVLARLGDGHGRRVLVVEPTGGPWLTAFLAELTTRAWAVSVCCADRGSAAAGRCATEAAGLVVDWRSGGLDDLRVEGRCFAAVACLGDPGFADHAVAAQFERVLRCDGILVIAVSEGVVIPELAGFIGVAIRKRAGVVVLSARRA